MDSKKIEIVIPTYRPGEELRHIIKRLNKQSYPIEQIHIIDTVAEDTGIAFDSLGDNIKLTRIMKAEFDHGGTRARGMEESKAEIVVFMTQDALPADTHLIEKLVHCFEDEKVGVAYARQLPKDDCRIIEKYTRSFNYSSCGAVKTAADLDAMGVKTYFCSDVCAAYRKDIYNAVGGFEKKVIFNEDMILAAKLIQSGYKVAYAAEAKVIHSHNYSWRQQFRRNFDLAVSQACHPEIFRNVSSESEGIRLIKKTVSYLLKIRKPWLIFSLIFSSGFKYSGYWLGKHYRKLPMGIIQRCTMNPAYWGFS
ncbi:MAG: glycosyltransferase [Hespellia sp.]|nr:glycosyltransferase [Hespellia sp.]